jgi:hypothetical protein
MQSSRSINHLGPRDAVIEIHQRYQVQPTVLYQVLICLQELECWVISRLESPFRLSSHLELPPKIPFALVLGTVHNFPQRFRPRAGAAAVEIFIGADTRLTEN